MSWLKMWIPGREARMVELASRVIAEKCYETVHQRLSDVTRSMSLPEVRGYIRARAGLPVRREVRLTLRGRSDISRQVIEQIAKRATERVVHAIIRDLLTETVPAMQIRQAA